ncbi:hypothetical protein B0T24DRAFT_627771 [Lasiosphaeria ovina]|uniref:Uncharacterized protein n=1 Tax=Lasiosphaeria ovina TaxID=92902 RepID=A0AAE0K7R3_9PEZI|nr:hypothetical protein B0T24DRAFT_627771 [Lasiosphaeria ovina]
MRAASGCGMHVHNWTGSASSISRAFLSSDSIVHTHPGPGTWLPGDRIQSQPDLIPLPLTPPTASDHQQPWASSARWNSSRCASDTPTAWLVSCRERKSSSAPAATTRSWCPTSTSSGPATGCRSCWRGAACSCARRWPSKTARRRSRSRCAGPRRGWRPRSGAWPTATRRTCRSTGRLPRCAPRSSRRAPSGSRSRTSTARRSAR